MFDPSWNSVMHQIEMAERTPDCMTPLSKDEQDDLFRQMDKWLERGGIRQIKLLEPEVENMFRMRATILKLREQQ